MKSNGFYKGKCVIYFWNVTVFIRINVLHLKYNTFYYIKVSGLKLNYSIK